MLIKKNANSFVGSDEIDTEALGEIDFFVNYIAIKLKNSGVLRMLFFRGKINEF